MSGLLYNIAIIIIYGVIRVMAPFSAGIKAFLHSRKLHQFPQLNTKNQAPRILIHCPSLGEFEQGRPVLDQIKKQWPESEIILTFFSPSGFEIRKNYSNATAVAYLPLDFPWSVKRFIHQAAPDLVVLVKYDFWPNLIQTLSAMNIPIVAISCIFRPQQIYFKWFGTLFRQTLKNINHFFVQDNDSAELLKKIGIENSSITGDTRFDRVVEIKSQVTRIYQIEKFLDGKPCLVIGSAWPDDIKILRPCLKKYLDRFKVIIVPHKTDQTSIQQIEKVLDLPCIKWTVGLEGVAIRNILILDTIGLLSSVYQYASLAYVGGGLGEGLHNILEPIVFEIPVFFGNKNYTRFREAKALADRGAAFPVSNADEAEKVIASWIESKPEIDRAGSIARDFIKENIGATSKIVSELQKHVKLK